MGRVAVLATETRFEQRHDRNFHGNTIAEALGLARTAGRMKAKHKLSPQADALYKSALKDMEEEEGRDCFGEALVNEFTRETNKATTAEKVAASKLLEKDIIIDNVKDTKQVCDTEGHNTRKQREGVHPGLTYEDFLTQCIFLVRGNDDFLRPAIGRISVDGVTVGGHVLIGTWC